MKRLNPTPLTPAEAIANLIKIAAVEMAKTPATKTNPTCQGRGCLSIFMGQSTSTLLIVRPPSVTFAIIAIAQLL